MADVPVPQTVFGTTTNVAVINLLNGDTVTVGAGIGVYGVASGAGGIRGAGNNTITVAGEVFSKRYIGINLDAGNNTLTVASGGEVYGHNEGIFIQGGGNSITNRGEITSLGGTGIFIGTSGNNTLNNSGTIRSDGYGFLCNLSNNTVVNSGLIETGDIGVLTNGSVTNSGTIRALTGVVSGSGSGSGVTLTNLSGGEIIATLAQFGVAFAGGSLVDVFINNGTVTSAGINAVTLGSGNDTYNGRGGSVTGAVIGGIGTDTLLGGALAETLRGQQDNDRLEGGGGNDVLDGGPGNDVMKGGAGADLLVGGSGTDTLFGEAGNDTFRFTTVTDTVVGPNRDVIQDFDDSGLGDDRIDLKLMPGVTDFIDQAAFTAPGQVRIHQAGANVLVQVNTAGNDTAEAEILIANATIGAGVGQVNAGDFLL